MADAPPIVRTVYDLQRQVAAWRAEGERVVMVPTMGSLHEGHLSLVRQERRWWSFEGKQTRVVASIFVNPTQFAPHEDFDAYPRDEARDAALLGEAECDLIYAPTVDVMYPKGVTLTVAVDGVSAPLEGEMRPHFFGGVATVVTKLLMHCQPDIAVFGEKDYQQLLVIRRVVSRLGLGVWIKAGPTVREADGLAMSSRNAYLSPEERAVAGVLPKVMHEAVTRLREGDRVDEVEADGRARLEAAGFGPVDYLQVHDGETMERIGPEELPAGSHRLFVAAWLGKTRLIDNRAL